MQTNSRANVFFSKYFQVKLVKIWIHNISKSLHSAVIFILHTIPTFLELVQVVFFLLLAPYYVTENGYPLYGHLCCAANRKKVDLKGGGGAETASFRQRMNYGATSRTSIRLKKRVIFNQGSFKTTQQS